jgi:hypothetical protein
MRTGLIFKIGLLVFVMGFVSIATAFSEVHVYDANDQYLGLYMGTDNDGFFIEIYVPNLGNSIIVIENDIQDASTICFESEDCSGTAYEDTLVPRYPVFPLYLKGDCQDKYYYRLPVDQKKITPKSYLSGCQCIQYPGSPSFNGYFELVEVPKSSFPFTLPLALPLKLKYSTGGDINGDEKIGLEEAVNALQITSGLKNPGPPTGGRK